MEDPETSLNEVNTVLESIGITMTDSEGQIRDVSDLLDEMAAKWDTLTRNQQNQLSTAVAGTRQAVRLVLLQKKQKVAA